MKTMQTMLTTLVETASCFIMWDIMVVFPVIHNCLPFVQEQNTQN